MFTHYRTKGFIIKKEDRGEFDRLFTVFTEEFGKLDLLARAERKIASKLRAGLELFYLSEIEFIQGKAYKTLTDAILIDSFPNIKKSLGKLEVSLRITRLVNKLVKGEEADEEIWNLVLEVFSVLDNWRAEKNKLKLLYYYFVWNFFSILGYRLEVDRCIFCQKEIAPGKIFFKAREGGMICEQCESKSKESKPVGEDLVKIVRLFLSRDLPILKRLKVSEEELKNLQDISRSYLLLVLEKMG